MAQNARACRRGKKFVSTRHVSVGGSATGKGYGQILAYTISLNGNVGVVENYNPIALAYVPVLVQ